jgi:drug/metabolite transporter (DMT)-like permease
VEYLLAVIAAFGNAVATIMQRLGVETAPADAGLSTRLVAHMVQRRVWIGGFIVMAGAFGAQAWALYVGSLAVVQPILVTELVFVVIALAAWFSMRVTTRDVIASLLAAGGLATFLAVARPQPGSSIPGNVAWAVAIVVVGLPAVALVLAGRRGAPSRRAMLIGAGASLGFALTAALTKAATDALAHGFVTLLTTWQTYGLVIIGAMSFVLMQSALHAGPFTSSQVTLILVNPLASIVIGTQLFHDSLTATPIAIVVEIVALVVMALGAFWLATSPMLAEMHDDAPDRHLLSGRGRLARYRARRAASS